MKFNIKYPLKIKLLMLLTTMLIVSLSIFVNFAIQIFKEDKSAYIFEALLAKANTEKIIVENRLRTQNAQFESLDDKLLIKGLEVNRSSLFGTDDELIKSDLVIQKDNQFYKLDEKLSPLEKEKSSSLSDIFTNKIFEAVKEISIDKEKLLFGYAYSAEYDFLIVSTLPYEVAFGATDELIQKSLYFGILLLGLCLIMSIFLVRPLTRQLEILFDHTKKIASGDFKSKVEVKGNDEVSALTLSINNMSGQIEQYIEEMKEKARLESEVAVAQLVQSSFFPDSTFDDEKINSFSFYRPASECGGDWWGQLHTPTHKIFFIADATGHGVPAALLTATMNCCKNSLSFFLESKPELVQRPEEILRYMNLAVWGSGNKIQVTCFVAILEISTNKLVYANASHPAPLIFNTRAETLEKSDISVLQGGNGPRLGERTDASYESQAIELKPHDTIILYTDGIIEAENSEGKRWGERRLLKVITENYQKNCQELINSLIGSVQAFSQDSSQADDYTIVSFKVKT